MLDKFLPGDANKMTRARRCKNLQRQSRHQISQSEVQGFILFEKHAGDNTVYGVKKAVEEGTVIQEKAPKLFINGKDAINGL